MSLIDESLYLLVCTDPETGTPYIGDQYGRRLENVKHWAVRSDISGREVSVKLSDASHLIVKPPPELTKRAPTRPTPHVRTSSGDSVSLDGKRNLVVLRVPEDARPDVWSAMSDNVRALQKNLPDDLVILLQEDHKLEVISLDASAPKLSDSMERRKTEAEWDF